MELAGDRNRKDGEDQKKRKKMYTAGQWERKKQQPAGGNEQVGCFFPLIFLTSFCAEVTAGVTFTARRCLICTVRGLCCCKSLPVCVGVCLCVCSLESDLIHT